MVDGDPAAKIRELLARGERPDARILRPEIADILIGYYREKAQT